MKLDRILVIAKKKFRSLRHDRRTARFIFVVPFIMILVFGYTFGGDVKNISVYVVNLDEGFGNQSLYWKIIDELNESDTFSIIQIYTVEDVSSDPVNLTIDEVRSAKVWATIIFDESFTRNAISNIISLCLGRSFSPSNMTMYIDGTNPNVAASIVRGVTESLQALLIEEYHMTPPVAIETEMIYGEDTEFIDFFAPDVMGLAGLLVTFMLTIVTFVRERSTSTLEKLLTTPATKAG